MGVNPQVRSAVKNYGYSIYQRDVNPSPPSQTDRQTDTELAIIVPEINIDEEHNNADEEDD